MHQTLKGFLAVAMFLTSFIGTGIYLESQSFETPRSYVQYIYNENGSGSVVVIAPGYVLTAAHVAVNKGLLINGKPTEVVAIDEETDIAFLKADVDCPCAPIGKTPDIGDRAVAIGYSLGEIKMATEGDIQGWTRGMMYSDTSIVFGNSGGGVFTFQRGQWKLVGITVQVSGAQAGFFGIPVFHMVRSVPTEKIVFFIHHLDQFKPVVDVE